MDNLEKNTGIDEYPEFDEGSTYSAGDVVSYNGLLYKFTTDHAAGAWTGTDAEETDVVKAHIVQELGDSEDKVVSQYEVAKEITLIHNKFNQEVVSDNEEINNIIKELYSESLSKNKSYVIRLYNQYLNEKPTGLIIVEIYENNVIIGKFPIGEDGLVIDAKKRIFCICQNE